MSHLVARLRAQTATGIDRIDLAFASHYFAAPAQCEAVRYGSSGPPRNIESAWALEFTRAAQSVWTEAEPSQAETLWAWLESSPDEAVRPQPAKLSRGGGPDWSRRLLSWAGYLMRHRSRRSVPPGAIYINVGYHRFEHPEFFEWLAARPDVDGVFMIHDLLPLDYPEYFQPGEALKFRTRIATALRYGRAFLVSTEAVRGRLQREIAARGLTPRPIWARPFPSPLADFAPSARHGAAHPYFVVVGTIEPRKNHLLLLQIWRAMAQRLTAPPRLVIVGARGWENEQVLDMLDRCEALKPHVAEASNLGSRDLAELIAGARAVLAPSFAEGYGLPIVEALALGTPVVATDTEAAREVSQGRAQLLSALDGEGWSREIERLAADPGYHAAQRARAAGFVAPNWRDYFASLDQFVAGLRAVQPPVNPADGA
jgi:glycosyltransferase involved in cell wall biosynthesis